MAETMHALLSGIIDYAGLFPPAALSLDEAVSNLRRYRKEPQNWMLGRFVCPVGRLTDLALLNWGSQDGPLAVLLPATKSEDEFFKLFNEATSSIDGFPDAARIDTLEMLCPTDVVAEGTQASFGRFLAKVAGTIVTWQTEPLTLFFEFAAADASLPDHSFQARLTAAVARVAHFNQVMRNSPYQFGVKFRTGGTASTAIPSASKLAIVIAVCRGAGVFWKATGGLHQPWRHVDQEFGVPLHGFLNILAAATLAMTEGLNAPALERILDDDQPSHFRLDSQSFTWGDHTMAAAQVSTARTASFRSFGSCSFEEPQHYLQTQRWS